MSASTSSASAGTEHNGSTAAALVAPIPRSRGENSLAELDRSETTSGTRGLTQQQLQQLLGWIRPLQQALTLEIERDCSDVQGRQQRFHQFLEQQLAQPPALPFPKGSPERLETLQQRFGSYPGLERAQRRRLITETRQWLHGLRSRLEPSAPMAPRN